MSDERICQGNAKRSRTGRSFGGGRVGLGPMTERLGIRGVERLGRQAIRRSRLGFNPGYVCRVGHGDRLRVFVLGVMFLGVDLFVFLQVLRTFERLLADLANMRFERRVDCRRGQISQCASSGYHFKKKKLPRR